MHTGKCAVICNGPSTNLVCTVLVLRNGQTLQDEAEDGNFKSFTLFKQTNNNNNERLRTNYIKVK